MSQSKKQNKLLEAYIEQIVKYELNEDFESDYGFTPSSGDYGAGHGGGAFDGPAGYGSGNQLYQTFIQPFVDVGQTALYGIEKLTAQTATVVKGILFGLPTLFIPFLDYDYEKFREDEKANVKDIENKYKEVLGRNWEAITSNDAFGLAFVFQPAAFLGFKLASKAPDLVLRVLDTLTQGTSAVVDAAKQFHVALQGHTQDLHEKVDAKLVQTVQQLLKDPKVQQAINQNPIVQQGRQKAMNIMVDRVKKFMVAKTYDELQKLAPTAVGKVTQSLQTSEKQNQIPPQQDTAAKAALMPQLKQKYKEFYIKKLNDTAKQDPQMKPFVQNAIKQIQALR